MTAHIPFWLLPAGTVVCLGVCACFFFWYRRNMKVFEKILEKYEKEGKIHPEEWEETVESRLLHQLCRVLERADREKEKAREEKRETAVLLSDISHQLKTPLANIILNTEILKAGRLTGAEPEMFLKRNEEQAKKMQWLMKTLVKASRLEQGIFAFESSPAPLAETLARSVGAVYTLAEEKNITVEARDFQECMPCHNPKWTAEAIGNILENAVKYSPAGSRIFIEVQPLEIYTKIKITDQGPGIPREEYNAIFKRFYRGKNVEQEEGNGLGLYLAQVILQSEKGYVTVSSPAEGGSCFSVFLLNCYQALESSGSI